MLDIVCYFLSRGKHIRTIHEQVNLYDPRKLRQPYPVKDVSKRIKIRLYAMNTYKFGR